MKLLSGKSARRLAQVHAYGLVAAVVVTLVIVVSIVAGSSAKWSIWTTVFVVAGAVGVAMLLVSVAAAFELLSRRSGDYVSQTEVFEFTFLLSVQVINKFEKDLNAAAKTELPGVRFWWSWETMSLQCEYPGSRRDLSQWANIETVTAFIKKHRPLAAHPMRRFEPMRRFREKPRQ